ncbi:type III secretion system chaperone [Yoonia sp. BS5-3]|uniref:Type III secretion system chaperone n=1 Tax=Yoonia phaeophyticola TaxID=3137369 RepID=A0ABZ2V3W8_9RHOB
MQQADEILDFLNTKLGAESLVWQGDHASIKFEDETIIDFVKIDMHTIELVHVIEKFTGVADATICTNLLIGNYQGGMTGAARLSLTPDFKTLALCSRIDVRAIDTVLFEELMTDFLKYVQFWNSDEAASYLQGDEEVMNTAAAPQDTEAFMTRV